ncbi:MAG: RecX family transcriptional regulator [Saprospiraceae bacterium]|nr:RecX family transcriptional regulator [Saprospiraceae bacterium]
MMTRRSNRPLTPDEALAKMEHFCAYRERCPKEVRAKLAELGMKGADAAQILEVLSEDGFFDEERFALAYAGGKFRMNHWGRVRIRQELRMRDINESVIRRALGSIDEQEYLKLLNQLVEKKSRQYAGDGHAREKTAASLIRAGFEPELVFRYL